MDNHARSAADLHQHLERHGAQVALDDDGETVALAIDEERVAAIRWRPRSRAVLLTIPTGLGVTAALHAPTLLELARIIDALDAPGFTLDLDDGAVEYRARLVTNVAGALELEVFEGTLQAALACVERVLPRLGVAIRRSRRSAVHNAATAFAGYVE